MHKRGLLTNFTNKLSQVKLYLILMVKHWSNIDLGEKIPPDCNIYGLVGFRKQRFQYFFQGKKKFYSKTYEQMANQLSYIIARDF